MPSQGPLASQCLGIGPRYYDNNAEDVPLQTQRSRAYFHPTLARFLCAIVFIVLLCSISLARPESRAALFVQASLSTPNPRTYTVEPVGKLQPNAVRRLKGPRRYSTSSGRPTSGASGYKYSQDLMPIRVSLAGYEDTSYRPIKSMRRWSKILEAIDLLIETVDTQSQSVSEVVPRVQTLWKSEPTKGGDNSPVVDRLYQLLDTLKYSAHSLHPLDKMELIHKLTKIAGGWYNVKVPISKIVQLVLSSLQPADIKVYSGQDIINILWAAAKLELKNVPNIKQLEKRLGECIHNNKLAPDQTATTVWALSKLDTRDKDLMIAVTDQSLRLGVISTYGNYETVIIMYGIAKMKFRRKALIEGLSNRFCEPEVLERSAARDISNMLWSLGTFLVRNETLLDAVAKRVSETNIMAHGKCQDIANALWGMAKLKYHGPGILQNMAEAVMQPSVLATCKSEYLAIIMWSYATLNIRSPAMMQALGKQVIKVQDSLSPQNIANIAWAHAKLDILDIKLFACLTKQALDPIVLKAFGPQALSNTIWALASLDFTPLPLLAAFAKQAVRPQVYYNLSPLSTTMIAVAYARAGFLDQKLMYFLEDRATYEIKFFKAQELANIAWAYSKLTIPARKLMQAIADAVLDADILDHIIPSEAANLLWAFATQGFWPEPTVETLIDYLMEDDTVNMLNAKDISMISISMAMIWGSESPKDFCAVLTKRAVEIVPQLTPRTLTQTFAAMISIGHIDHDFTEATLGLYRNSSFVARCGQLDVSQFVMAFAELDSRYQDPELLTVLMTTMKDRHIFGSLSPSGVANLMAGLARVHYEDDGVYEGLIQRALVLMEDQNFTQNQIDKITLAMDTIGLVNGKLTLALLDLESERLALLTRNSWDDQDVTMKENWDEWGSFDE